MKYLLIMAIALLAGCDAAPSPNGRPNEDRAAYTLRTYDSQYGVACYRMGASTYNLSCVKVTP